MNEGLLVTIVITLAVALVLIVVIIAILLYNQMLLLNEVNKRLLLMTKESVDRERATQEDLTQALRELDAAVNEQTQSVTEETPTVEDDIFDPHTYDPNI